MGLWIDRCPLTGTGLQQRGFQTGCNFTPGHGQMERELEELQAGLCLKTFFSDYCPSPKVTARLQVLSSISEVGKI